MMGLIYFLLVLIGSVYFICMPYLFYQEKITVSELITFLAVLPLALIAIFQEMLKRWFFAPKLFIDFKLEAPFCSKTPFYITGKERDSVEHRITTEAYGFRFGVRNTGKSQAKLCEVYIAELMEFKNNIWSDTEYFQQVHLQWDRGEPGIQYTNINPSPVRTLCDIGHIVKKTDKMFEEEASKFSLSQVYIIGGYQPKHLDSNKKYRFKIIVSDENAGAISQNFELHWSGKWRDDAAEMFKEIVIKKV